MKSGTKDWTAKPTRLCLLLSVKKKKKSNSTLWEPFIYHSTQWRSQDFSLKGAKLINNINLKILINNNNKINKQLQENMNIFHSIKINKQK